MASYTVIDKTGDVQYISTWVSSDKIERIIACDTCYCSVHGRSAVIGSQWELAVHGKDEYCDTVAQTWVNSLEGEGDIFNPEEFSYITEGRVSTYSLP